MKIAYLGPFINKKLQPFIPDLSDEDCKKSPGLGGFGLIELVEERLRQKYDTIVITLDTHLEKEVIIRKGNYCSLYSLPRRKKKLFRDLYSKEKYLISEAIRDSKPDLIHAHWTGEYALSVLKLKIPYIITSHDNPKDILKYLGWHYFPQYLLSNYIIKKAKFITAVSLSVLDYLKNKRSYNYELIPNPLPKMLLDECKNHEKSYDFVFPILTAVLDWNELKNPKNAILGFNLILKYYPKAQLYLFGRGMGINENCHKWSITMNLDKNIFFVGKVSNIYLRDHLKKTTLLLHTSRTEACSMIIAEAMAMGVPVIAGNATGGVPWQLDYGTAGILTDINVPEEITKAILELLNSIDLRRKLGREAKKRAMKIFNPILINQMWETLYLKIIGQNYDK